MPRRDSTRIGFIGVGAMGAPMAGHLVRAGYDVLVRDRSDTRRADFLTAVGGREANDARAFAEGLDVVITMLPDGAAVWSALVDDGVADALGEEALVIDMSSAAPWETERLADALAPRRVIDAPVSGGVKKAEAGTLAIMVGGAEADLEAARPILETMGAPSHAGRLGAGQAIKALNNMLSAVGMIATLETLIAAGKYGLEPSRALEILNGSTGRNNTTENKIAPFVLSRRFDSAFALELMVKDLTTARALGERAGAPLMLGGLARELSATAALELGAGADHTEVARWLEARAAFTLSSDDKD